MKILIKLHDAQADLNLRWTRMFNGTFSDVEDRMYIDLLV